jgi:hypothetical protein
VAKIILFIFALKPLFECFALSLSLINSMKIFESFPYVALIAIAVHYGYIGLKEKVKDL